MTEVNPINQGLVMIHRIISRGIKHAIEKSREFANSSSGNAQGLLLYITALRNIIHSHHMGEDDIVFPYFLDKLSAPYARLEADHQVFAEIIDEIDGHLKEINTGNVANIAELLEKMDVLWGPHIKLEEEYFTAGRLNELMSKEEQERLVQYVSKHGQKNAGPGYLILPFVIYSLDTSERAWISDLPWFVRKIMVPVIWKNKWKPMQPYLSHYGVN